MKWSDSYIRERHQQKANNRRHDQAGLQHRTNGNFLQEPLIPFLATVVSKPRKLPHFAGATQEVFIFRDLISEISEEDEVVDSYKTCEHQKDRKQDHHGHSVNASLRFDESESPYFEMKSITSR